MGPVQVHARVVCFQWCVFSYKSACDTRADNSNLLGGGQGVGDVDGGGSDGVGSDGCDGRGGCVVVIVVVMVVVLVVIVVVW